MAFAYNNPVSKLERAFRQLMIVQGVGGVADSFTSTDPRSRIVPGRVYVGVSFSPKNVYRNEGWVHFQIQHHFSAEQQPDNPAYESQAQAGDLYFGETLDTIFGLGDGYSLTGLANAVTAAGRDLATPNPNLAQLPAAEQVLDTAIVTRNADMLTFRCDEVKLADPLHTRGTDTTTTNWVEIIHLHCFVSYATLSN